MNNAESPSIDVADLRRDYTRADLDETSVDPDPIAQFARWFGEALSARLPEPNAMTLATATADGVPSARTVLVKGYDARGFVFYTSYASQKGLELAANPRAALVDLDLEAARVQMQDGEVSTIVVVPAGYGDAVAAASAGSGPPAAITVYTDPSRESATAAVFQSIGAVLGVVNLGGRPPLVVPQPETIQTENLNFISYFVPSMLALSVMQVGIFAAIPLVAEQQAFLPQSSTQLDAARASYLAGRGDFPAVIEGFEAWLETRMQLASREAERYTTWAEIEALVAPPAAVEERQ